MIAIEVGFAFRISICSISIIETLPSLQEIPHNAPRTSPTLTIVLRTNLHSDQGLLRRVIPTSHLLLYATAVLQVKSTITGSALPSVLVVKTAERVYLQTLTARTEVVKSRTFETLALSIVRLAIGNLSHHHTLPIGESIAGVASSAAAV